jgi:hypothetical protein
MAKGMDYGVVTISTHFGAKTRNSDYWTLQKPKN